MLIYLKRDHDIDEILLKDDSVLINFSIALFSFSIIFTCFSHDTIQMNYI